MSPGSEPERDDTGLPPVDVQVPDDARELDRDVQAYHRELRARRRLVRTRRLRSVFGRESMVIPLLICCLVFALISGTLLTLFTATSIDQNLPGQSQRPAAAPPRLAVTMAPDLRGALVTVASRRTPEQLSSLGPAVLLLVRCSCAAPARELASLAASEHVPAYLLVAPGSLTAADHLARQLGHGIVPAEDVTGRLERGHSGLTAFLVTKRGGVSYADRLQSAGYLNQLLQAGEVTPAVSTHA